MKEVQKRSVCGGEVRSLPPSRTLPKDLGVEKVEDTINLFSNWESFTMNTIDNLPTASTSRSGGTQPRSRPHLPA